MAAVPGGTGGSFQCAVCGDALEDALILICNHNLCLNCAGKNLKANESYESGQPVALTCSRCNAVTNVDAESATHLVENVNTVDDVPVGGGKLAGRAGSGGAASSDHSSTRAGMSKTPMITGVQGVSSLCPSHPDEPLQYFCLDCESKCVCAECVIHGMHKGHECLSVKKA